VIQVVTVAGFDAHGITLTAPDAAGFDARVFDLVPRWASLAVGLKPFLVLLSNGSAQTVVAYSVVFNATRRNGTFDRTVLKFKYPDAVAGNERDKSPFGRGREIAVGEQRVVGLQFEIMPDVDNGWLIPYGAMQRDQFHDTDRLEVGIDAVVFSDGTLIGPDTSGLAEHFSAYLDATQALYRRVVANIDLGTSVADVFAAIEAESRAQYDASRDRPPGGGSDVAFYNGQAAGDARRHRSRYGDAAVRELFARAIRTTPFTVRRVRDK